jgi:hypothetical protein
MVCDGEDENVGQKSMRQILFMRWWQLIVGEDIKDGVTIPILCASMVAWHQAMDLPTWLFHLSVLRCARNKSFFVTNRGVYGVAAKTVRKRDTVALLAGVLVALILRVVEGGYEYIGFAAVDWCRHGEAWNASKARSLVLV